MCSYAQVCVCVSILYVCALCSYIVYSIERLPQHNAARGMVYLWQGDALRWQLLQVWVTERLTGANYPATHTTRKTLWSHRANLTCTCGTGFQTNTHLHRCLHRYSTCMNTCYISTRINVRQEGICCMYCRKHFLELIRKGTVPRALW